ncbi:MAG: hypothetical protein M1475_00145 [Actinobacteria bacterium]|nr:hypothetical protein [Actinomycetota bacterium]
MSIITVQGLKSENELGVISPHEHILIDIRNQAKIFNEASKAALSEKKVALSNLDLLSRNPYAIKDNLVLNDLKLAEKELIYFKKAGGDTLVDATPKDIGRDPEALYEISRATGINIIAGTGYYTQDTHYHDLTDCSVEEISKQISKEIIEGIENTDIKAGIIGEIGLSKGILENEKKVLIAAGLAQKETGAGMLVHIYPWSRDAIAVLDILKDLSCNLKKVCICHIDIEIDINYCEEICRRGAFIEFDNFGKEFCLSKKDFGFAGGAFARDIERVKAVKEIIDKGFLSQILLSNDICLKTLLHRYGGWGYDHVLNNIIPMLREEGISKDQIDFLIKYNPKNFLNID